MNQNYTEKDMENRKREKLKREKPFVYDKIMHYDERYKNGIPSPIIDIGYSYACNLSCEHCSCAKYKKKNRRLTPDDVFNFSSQCHELGYAQFNLSGGEPLIWKDLFQVIEAMQPDKFHLSMSTHAHFMTPEMAQKLKKAGIDKVKISLDHVEAEEHDKNRNNAGAYQKALDGMRNAKAAGLNVVVQHVVSHQTCQDGHLPKIAEFCEKNDYSQVDILIARAIGEWEGKHEVLCTPEDIQYMKDLFVEHPVLHRNTYPAYGMNVGCNTIMKNLHLTQYGDLQPCVYIQISLGNIYEKKVKEIVDDGLKIKYFNKYSQICISGEDRHFIETFLSKTYGKPIPVHYSEIFTDKTDYLS